MHWRTPTVSVFAASPYSSLVLSERVIYMNLPFFNRGSGPAKRNLLAEARQFRLKQNLRALLLVLPLVAGIVVLVGSFLTTPEPEVSTEYRSPAFSGVHSRPELTEVLKASRAAFNEYIKRDRVVKRLDRVAERFAKVRSEADLNELLRELSRVSGDKYAEVLSTNQYDDRVARMAGKVIGVDLDFQADFQRRGVYTISRCGETSDAYAQGLRVGDRLISIDDRHVDQMALPNPWQTQQRLKQIVDGGLLGSTVRIVCRKEDDTFVEVVVPRVVLYTGWNRTPTFNEGPVWGGGGQVQGARQITVQNLWNPDTLVGLTDTLKRYQLEEIRGVLLDLQKVDGCEGDTAVRVAALFMEKGIIAHRISVTPDGELMMHTWEAKDGKVQVTETGPFAVDAEGALDPKAKKEPKVEMLSWESNVYQGDVVVLMGDETSGGGEVISAALMSDTKRHVVTSMYLTAGKGTYQSYFQVGPEHVLAVSTAFYLRPDGASIEAGDDGKGGRIMPNAIPQNARSVEEFAQGLLNDRMRVVPAPDLPPEPKALDPVPVPVPTPAPAPAPVKK